MRKHLWAVLLSSLLAASAAWAETITPPNLKVAFLGDQGLGIEAAEVVKLIRDEKAAAIIHQGDLDYDDKPAGWENMMNAYLGDDFPIFAAIGNHDKKSWDEYQKLFETRLAKIPEAHCQGDYGVKMRCSYKGLFFVLSGVGTKGRFGHTSFIEDSLKGSDAVWKICNWHKNMAAMQVGLKWDETGWDPYEVCREQGAIVATGHEHSYARTHLMSSFKKREVASRDSTLVLEPGSSFAFVSGLGGRPIRKQYRGGDWWARVYTASQNAKHGALFCTFHVDKDPRKAHCYLKNIDREIIDEFWLESRL